MPAGVSRCAASALCAIAPSVSALVAARVLQAVGAAVLVPTSLGLLLPEFPLERRATATALWGATGAVAAAAGPSIGGVLVDAANWRWVFLINLPIGLVCAFLFLRYREQREHGGPPRLDYLGALILTAGVAVLLYGLGTGNPSGRPIWPVAGAGAALLVFFFAREFRTDSPTIPVRLLGDALIGPAIGVSMLAGTLMFGVNAYLPLYVQARFEGFDTPGAYAASVVLALIAIATVVGLRAFHPREETA